MTWACIVCGTRPTGGTDPMETAPEDVLTGDRRSVKESTSDIGHLDPAPGRCLGGADLGIPVPAAGPRGPPCGKPHVVDRAERRVVEGIEAHRHSAEAGLAQRSGATRPESAGFSRETGALIPRNGEDADLLDRLRLDVDGSDLRILRPAVVVGVPELVLGDCLVGSADDQVGVECIVVLLIPRA